MVTLPNRVTRPRTRMTGSATAAPSASSRAAATAAGSRASDPEDGEDDRKAGIEQDDEEDRFDDGVRRQPPDALGAARRAQPLVAPGQRDDRREDRRLHDAD